MAEMKNLLNDKEIGLVVLRLEFEEPTDEEWFEILRYHAASFVPPVQRPVANIQTDNGAFGERPIVRLNNVKRLV